MFWFVLTDFCCGHDRKSFERFYKVQSSSINRLRDDSYSDYFLQACFARYREHQRVDRNKIVTNGWKRQNGTLSASSRHIANPSHGW